MARSASLGALLAALGIFALSACDASTPPGPTVVVSPAAVTLAQLATQQFTAKVGTSDSTAVDWTVAPSGGGTITAGGLYVAPALAGTFTVRAASQLQPASIGTATVTVLEPDGGLPPDGGSGSDAGIDAGSDAGNDGGDDAGSDAGTDGGSDAGTDAGRDAGEDAGSDAGADGGSDAGATDAGTLAFSKFSASPVAISPSGTTTLSWVVSGATSLSLEDGSGASQTVTGSSLQVTPAASSTYLLTAKNGSASITLPASVTVRPNQPAPLIEQLASDSSSISSPHSTTLRWTVVNSTQVTISGLGTVAASGSQSIAPSATTTYSLSATGAGGSATATVTVTVDSSPQLTPVDPGGGDVKLTIDSSLGAHPISPYVYGYNANTIAAAAPGAGMLRQGGNRFTAYNWETNASNAGSDYLYESDNFLGGGSTPGGAVTPTLTDAGTGTNIQPLVTIPIQGWVAADEAGPVVVSAPNIDRFFPTAPREIGALSTTPDLTDKLVFDDQLAFLLKQDWTGTAPLALELDNEPDLWSSTHAEIEKSPVTYQELFDKSVGAASALKDAAPLAVIYGPVSYGWAGFVNLQSASDAAGRDFIVTYLQTLEAESRAQGRRLLDVLDLHWYSEATGGGTRVTTNTNAAAVVAARVQAPRSLWDSTYVEDSWITADTLGGTAIELLPRMMGKIATAFPGTKIALTEYSHGGGNDISGAVAEADTLGIFGQQGIYAASYWSLYGADNYTYGAYRAYRDYDGAGSQFGDTSISATSSAVASVSVYASINAGHPEKLLAVIINRDTSAHTADILLNHSQVLTTATVWQITFENQTGSTIAPIKVASGVALSSYNATTIAVPAMSVSTVVFE